MACQVLGLWKKKNRKQSLTSESTQFVVRETDMVAGNYTDIWQVKKWKWLEGSKAIEHQTCFVFIPRQNLTFSSFL